MAYYNVSIVKNLAPAWAGSDDLQTTTTIVEMSPNDARNLDYRLDASQDLNIIHSYSIDEIQPVSLRDWEWANYNALYFPHDE